MSAIVSKLHIARSVAIPGTIDAKLLDAMTQAPFYVFEWTLHNKLNKTNAVIHSIAALFQAGVCKLPFPTMALELWANPSQDWRYFIGVDEVRSGKWKFRAVEYVNGKITPSEQIGSIEFVPNPDNKLITDPLTGSEFSTGDIGYFICFEMSDRSRDDMLQHIAAGIMYAILARHIQGVEHVDVVAPRGFNKARAAKGRTTVAPYTIVRFGHVYDASGKRHSLTGTGRHMPVHLRAGYNRMQQHGERWTTENPDAAALPINTATHHVVNIKPVLVNYRDANGATFQPKPRLVTV